MPVVHFSSRKLHRWVSEEVKTLLTRSVALRSSEHNTSCPGHCLWTRPLPRHWQQRLRKKSPFHPFFLSLWQQCRLGIGFFSDPLTADVKSNIVFLTPPSGELELSLCPHSEHCFPAPSSKLRQIWLRHWRGTIYLRAAVHRRGQRPPKGSGTNMTVEAT